MTDYTSKSATRFWTKVAFTADPNKCWVWQACVGNNGYGVVKFNNKLDRAHRVAYRLTNGEIPKGMLILHQCDNRLCCNPNHLVLGTHADNMADMLSKGRQYIGGKYPSRKLTHEDVRSIRDRIILGQATRKQLAIEYGVSYSCICDVAKGKTWVILYV